MVSIFYELQKCIQFHRFFLQCSTQKLQQICIPTIVWKLATLIILARDNLDFPEDKK